MQEITRPTSNALWECLWIETQPILAKYKIELHTNIEESIVVQAALLFNAL